MKVRLDLIEEPPRARALRRQHAAPVLQTPRGAAGDGAQDVEVGEERLGRRGLGTDARRRGVVGETQHQQRVGQDERARGLGPADVVLIQAANLPGGEAMRRDGLGEAPAVVALGARQRDEILHRGVRDDLALPDVTAAPCRGACAPD